MPAPRSIGDALQMAEKQAEVDAYNTAYSVATTLAKEVIARYGDHAASSVVKYWSEVSDGILAKVKADMDGVFKGK